MSNNNRFINQLLFLFLIIFVFESCHSSRRAIRTTPASGESGRVMIPIARNSENHVAAKKINTKNVDAASVVYFAKTLIGTPYKYGSTVKEKGFDCSGFITYVFNHFNISVPRSSVEFTNAGVTIPFLDSRKGDLILFTGTETKGWIVGHMGIITDNDNGRVKFIHSASGGNRGVMISDMSQYFFTRFVKVVRVFMN